MTDRLSEHPGKPTTGQEPARANPEDLSAAWLLHLAAQRMSEEEREALIERMARAIFSTAWEPERFDEMEHQRDLAFTDARAALSTLLPGPEEEGDDDD